VAVAPSSDHQQISRFGALKSWANTPDRSARTRPARSKSPASIEYHLERLDPVRFADATEAQKLAAAEAGRKAYFTELAWKSAAARRKASPDGA
jgi:hypothetical protein